MNPTSLAQHEVRRQRLMGAIGPEGVAIIPANREHTRNNDVDYFFRQDSNFVYLTGFYEPDGVLVLAPGHEDGESVLFVRARDPHAEQWTGRRVGKAAAPAKLGVDVAFEIDEIDEQILQFIAGRKVLHANFGVWPEFDQSVFGWLNTLRSKRNNPPQDFTMLNSTLHEMRLLKSDFELDLMRQAAAISTEAHRSAMRFTQPGKSEQQVEAELAHIFHCSGARHLAYPSIVAGGENACIMHYIDNDAELLDGDLLLIDAGCEINSYASDITRTFPINGTFRGPQKALYEVVLAANHAAIEAAQPKSKFTDPEDSSTRTLTEGLIDLGILEGDVDGLLETGAQKTFYRPPLLTLAGFGCTRCRCLRSRRRIT